MQRRAVHAPVVGGAAVSVPVAVVAYRGSHVALKGRHALLSSLFTGPTRLSALYHTAVQLMTSVFSLRMHFASIRSGWIEWAKASVSSMSTLVVTLISIFTASAFVAAFIVDQDHGTVDPTERGRPFPAFCMPVCPLDSIVDLVAVSALKARFAIDFYVACALAVPASQDFL